MSKIFDINSPVINFLGKIVDIIVLHFFWVIGCLPVVTFGPSTVALYCAMMRTTEDQKGHVYRTFWLSFRENLKQGIPLGLIFLLTEGGLAYSIYLTVANGKLIPGVMAVRIGAIFLAVLVFILFEYAFPLQARFENGVLQTMKNAVLLSLAHLGWTIVMTAVFVLYYGLYIYFILSLFPLAILGFGLVTFVNSYILNHIFKPYTEDEESKTEA